MYRRYNDRVRYACGRILANPQDVEEALQETFLKAYQALSRFNGRYQLGAWLSRIAHNVCLDEVRTRARGGKVIVLPPGEEYTEPQRSPEEMVTGERMRLHATFGELQPLHARALKLRAVDGLSHQEMARDLAMTPGQVKALLHRARRSFKRVWDKAEGWVIAPVVYLRSIFGERAESASKGGASQITSAANLTSSVSPFMVERVAASAVFVAVALSGTPTEPLDRVPFAKPSDNRGTAKIDIEKSAPTAHSQEPALAQAAAAPLAPEEAASEEDALLAAEVVVEPKKTLPPPKEEPPREPEDDDGLTDPQSADAKSLVKKVQKLGKELQKPPQ